MSLKMDIQNWLEIQKNYYEDCDALDLLEKTSMSLTLWHATKIEPYVAGSVDPLKHSSKEKGKKNIRVSKWIHPLQILESWWNYQSREVLPLNRQNEPRKETFTSNIG